MKNVDLKKCTFATGADIYMAAVESAKQKYSRSTDDYSLYEQLLESVYEYQLSKMPPEKQEETRDNTNNDWRQAYLPIYFLRKHSYISSKLTEPRARVVLKTPMNTLIDIPMRSWLQFRANSDSLDITDEFRGCDFLDSDN